MKRIACTLLVVATCAVAQSAPPLTIPGDATAPTADQLKATLAGKIFRVKVADGSSWRLDYRGNGYWYVDVSTGFRDTGKWRTEDGKLCTEGRAVRAACNDVRLQGEAIFLKRDSGEIVRLVAE
jgi:hypothetical protein